MTDVVGCDDLVECLGAPSDSQADVDVVDHNRRDVQLRSGELSDGDLWKLSRFAPLQRDWKALARNLQLEEQVLMQLEHEHAKAGARECCYQMLIRWREHSPQQAQFEWLYSNLTAFGYASVAHDFCSQSV